MQFCAYKLSPAQMYTLLPSAVKKRCSTLLKEKPGPTFGDLQLSSELLRYQSVKTAKDLWLHFSKKFDILGNVVLNAVSKEQATRLQGLIISTQKELDRISLSLLVNLEGLGRVDGKAAARIDGLNRLSFIVQSRIQELQNPPDCLKAKFLLADISRTCGYGCHAHYLMYCLHMAYATGRTLLLQSQEGFGGWWAEYYEPFSYKCSMNDVVEGEIIEDLDYTNIYSDSRLVHCKFDVFTHSQNISIAPPAVPEDLVEALRPLHGQPSVWFLGQLAQYIMRPRLNLQRQLDALLLQYQFTERVKRPIVGVHIRRTDKVTATEGEFHELSEYMKHVKRYFDYIEEQRRFAARIHEWNNDILLPERSKPYKLYRHVFLATDDPRVFREARENYPEYVFFGDPETAMSAQVQERDGEYSRTNIALDIHLLSRTDYIVCTLSSNVCRVAYELMQTRHEDLGDGGSLVQTLDTSFFWDGGQTITCEMIFDDEDLDLRRGDIVPVWSGNLNAIYENERLMNKTYFMDTPYKCIPRLISAKIGDYS
ncbi:unnamed protein product [Calicophoron daubneyi]|uniref:GT23 domain-containing protein n=1 Tax=Calicophoron daubneyi TaxID=300641 RepID=A0AAV2TNI4_CALDB